MKRMKNMKLLGMAAMLISMVTVLGACGNGGGTAASASGEIDYSVTAKDALGNAYGSGIIVQFLQDGTQVAMQPCDESGVATKAMEAGDYEVALMFTDGEDGFHYEKEGLSVSASEPALDITLSYAINTEPVSLVAQGDEYEAYTVTTGCTYVDLAAGTRNYFLFTPEEAGTYEVSVPDGANTSIGYYGATHYVQETSACEVVDNKFTVSVSASMIGAGEGGTSILVFGVDALDADTTNCVLGIQRIGDPEYSLADEPWTIYEKTVELEAYKLPAGKTVNEFDLTAATDAYNLVLNEADGYYHLDSADGPLVLVHLTKDPKYVDCFKTILDYTGILKYFFDENGEFEKKENYSDCVLEYIEYADEDSGLYPLTEDLKYIIQQFGDHQGWWDKDNEHGFMFVDEEGNALAGLNTEIAWLFMCCYIN